LLNEAATAPVRDSTGGKLSILQVGNNARLNRREAASYRNIVRFCAIVHSPSLGRRVQTKERGNMENEVPATAELYGFDIEALLNELDGEPWLLSESGPEDEVREAA
jgi:hypothetical protein